MGEIDTEDENRLWEEAEAKRRAEFAKKIKEEAEASAKRRAEEDRLWEEAWAKKKAEVEKRMREESEAATGGRAEDEKRLMEEAEAKRKAEEEKRRQEAAALAKRKAKEESSRQEEAEAKRKAEIEKRRKEAAALANRRVQEEENRLKKEASPNNRNAEQEQRLREEVEAKSRAREEQRPKETVEDKSNVDETYLQKFVAWARNAGEGQKGKNTNIKKRVLLGSLIAILGVLGIWAFSVFYAGPEEQSPPLPKIEATAVEDPNVLEKTEIDSPKEEQALSKLAIGDYFEGGIVFEIDNTGQTGKMAHLDDAGPMPWIDASNIHEKLGEGWRLPAFDELLTMYRTIGQGATNRGEFSNGLYWSATDYDEYQARLLRFRDGNTSYHYNKNVEHRKFRVRAVRDFDR